MANQLDINRAMAGKVHWNDWASKNAGVDVDFSGGSLGVFDFRDFTFPGGANFSQTQFSQSASFRGAVFKGPVQFDRGIFHRDAVFENAIFERGAYIAHQQFIKYANFRFATFRGKCDLTNSQFLGETVFTGATFREAIFRGVEVEHRLVTFESTTFTDVPDFRNSNFKTPPILYGMSVGTSKKAADSNAQDADKFRFLKMLASDAKDHQSELKFFALELRAKRGYETTGSAVLLSRAYEWASDFGQSVWLPVRGLLCLFLISWLVRVAACAPLSLSSVDVVLSHLAMSIADSFLLVGSEKWGLRETAISLAVCSRDFGLWQHVGALLQSVVSLALIFLIGLGLRNRFKMGTSN
jgi:uncharacterized protein YjbI with pentapeptide repeats